MDEPVKELAVFRGRILTRILVTTGVLIATFASGGEFGSEPPRCLETSGLWMRRPPTPVATDGRYIYFGSGSAIVVAEPDLNGDHRIIAEYAEFGWGSKQVFFNGKHLVVSGISSLSQRRFLRLIDVSDPTSPISVGPATGYSIARSAYSIASAGGYAYVVGTRITIFGQTVYFVMAFDLRDPNRPIEVLSAQPGGVLGSAIKTSDGLVYLPKRRSGFVILNDCEPPPPRLSDGRIGK